MKEFLMREFGTSKGQTMYDEVSKNIIQLIDENKTSSEQKMSLLKTSILPRIALYKVLQENIKDKKQCLEVVQKSFLEDLYKYLKLNNKNEDDNNFFEKFTAKFCSFIKSDNFKSEIEQRNEKELAVTVKKCIYNDTCVKNGCPELCEMFCKGDYVCYKDSKNIIFKRNHTLGTDGEYCDFNFTNSRLTV